MTDPTVRELVAELHAADPFWIVETAFELGRIGDPAAVQPLTDALPRTLAPEVTDFDIPCNNAVEVVDALVELGDARAAPAIRAALITAHAHEFVGAACAALVRLRDTAAVPVLERLLLDPDNEYCAGYLASALAALGVRPRASSSAGCWPRMRPGSSGRPWTHSGRCATGRPRRRSRPCRRRTTTTWRPAPSRPWSAWARPPSWTSGGACPAHCRARDGRGDAGRR